MNCNCFKREICLIHKDRPLQPVIDYQECLYVVKLHCDWPIGGIKTWYTTVSKDAIQTFKSDLNASKVEALKAASIHIL